jgi:hypothetical protein
MTEPSDVARMLERAERIEEQRRFDELRIIRTGSGTFRRVCQSAARDVSLSVAGTIEPPQPA